VIGQRLSHFELTAKLGEGGMGEVYRAEDPRLGRQVAIKVLPREVCRDPERLARFDREARILASLSHPSIASIYDVGSATAQPGAEPVHFLVMELVEGESLASRLEAGPLPVDEALRVATRVAEALEAAHRRGIVHRDLKPANVMVGPGGRTKVLDFGLAKALTPDGAAEATSSRLPTVTAARTREGTLLGTASYMSPEQARGQEADARTDVWAFGCLLWEMLTGERAFPGETATDALAAILERQPDWRRLPVETPPTVRRLLRRCLAKDPERRLRAIGDAWLELTEAHEEPAAVAAPATPAWRSLPAVAAIAGAACLVAFLAGMRLGGREAPAPSEVARPPTRVSIALPEGVRLAGWGSPLVAISPDGRRVAFVGVDETTEEHHLYLRSLDRADAERIEDSLWGEGPFFSPDGRWLGFAAGGELSGRGPSPGRLLKVPVEGGLPQTLCELTDYFGATWLEDDTILFVDGLADGLWRVPAGGGTPEAIDDSRGLFFPMAPPDSDLILALGMAPERFGNVHLFDPRTAERTPLSMRASTVRFWEDSLLFTDREGTVASVRLDLERREIAGSPRRHFAGVSSAPFGTFDLARAGTLVFSTGHLRGGVEDLCRLVHVERSGDVLATSDEPFLARGFAFDPEVRRIATSNAIGPLRVHDLERGTWLALTPDEDDSPWNWRPRWSPDGTTIAVTRSDAESFFDLFLVPADGSAPPRRLLQRPGEQYATAWTPDGTALVVESDGDLFLLALEGPELRPVADGPANERAGVVSPDGRWLAYESDPTGRAEVYLRRLDASGGIVPVSAGGGSDPLFSPDGEELYYRRGDEVYVVAVDLGLQARLGPPRKLFEVPELLDLAVDGDGFVARTRVPGSGIRRSLELVLDWRPDLTGSHRTVDP
jgi:tRNA A-37 threonylcarbamoyl transferase component Bud32